MVDFIYTQTTVNLLQVVLYIKLKMVIAYVSKRLPEAARKHSITEIEMCGVAIYCQFCTSIEKSSF